MDFSTLGHLEFYLSLVWDKSTIDFGRFYNEKSVRKTIMLKINVGRR